MGIRHVLEAVLNHVVAFQHGVGKHMIEMVIIS